MSGWLWALLGLWAGGAVGYVAGALMAQAGERRCPACTQALDGARRWTPDGAA